MKTYKIHVNCSHFELKAENLYDAIAKGAKKHDETRSKDVPRYYSMSIQEVEE